MEKLHKNANLTNFKQLNYPYTIKIALIKRNQTEQHHFKKKNHLQRGPIKSNPHFTSKFHRQMVLNTRSFQQKDDQKTKQEKATNKRKHHTYIPRRRESRKLRTIKSIFL